MFCSHRVNVGVWVIADDDLNLKRFKSKHNKNFKNVSCDKRVKLKSYQKNDFNYPSMKKERENKE